MSKEVKVYTAENSAIAQMLVEKLEKLDIPARVGTESASAGIWGVSGGLLSFPEGNRTIWVPEKLAKKAKEILTVR